MAVLKANGSVLKANGKFLKDVSKVLFFTDFSNYRNYTSGSKKYVDDTPITGNPWTIQCAEVVNGIIQFQSQVENDIHRYTPSFGSTDKVNFEFSTNVKSVGSYQYTYIWPHNGWGAMGIELSNLGGMVIKITLVKSNLISYKTYGTNRIITDDSSTLRIGFDYFTLGDNNPLINVKIQFDSGKYTILFNDVLVAEIEVNLSQIISKLDLFTQGTSSISKLGFIKISK